MSQNPIPRSKGAMLFMAAPIVFGGLLFLAVGTLALLVWLGDTADGERVRMKFQGECAEDSVPIIRERISTIGLGDVSISSETTVIDVVATLPSIENARNDIPLLLSRKGVLSVQDKDGVVLEQINITSATLDQDESGMPYTKIVFEEKQRKYLAEKVRQDPEGFLYFYLDDTQIVKRPNHNLVRSDELRLRSLEGGKKQQLKVTVDWSIVLEDGPLPCQIEVVSVEKI